jgi:hypothetical protein
VSLAEAAFEREASARRFAPAGIAEVVGQCVDLTTVRSLTAADSERRTTRRSRRAQRSKVSRRFRTVALRRSSHRLSTGWIPNSGPALTPGRVRRRCNFASRGTPSVGHCATKLDPPRLITRKTPSASHEMMIFCRRWMLRTSQLAVTLRMERVLTTSTSRAKYPRTQISEVLSLWPPHHRGES